MSKYIKLEDAIRTVFNQYMFGESDDIEEWEGVARRLFSHLPTIEVSDGDRNYCPNCGARMESDEE